MEYYATFTHLIDGATWGTREEVFQADSIEELKEQFKEFYENNETKRDDYLLDLLEDEEGNEIDIEPFLTI